MFAESFCSQSAQLSLIQLSICFCPPRGTCRSLNKIKNSQLDMSEMYVYERETILGCLLFLDYRKQIMAWFAWMLAHVISLLAFQAPIKISTG